MDHERSSTPLPHTHIHNTTLAAIVQLALHGLDTIIDNLLSHNLTHTHTHTHTHKCLCGKQHKRFRRLHLARFAQLCFFLACVSPPHVCLFSASSPLLSLHFRLSLSELSASGRYYVILVSSNPKSSFLLHHVDWRPRLPCCGAAENLLALRPSMSPSLWYNLWRVASSAGVD